MQQLTMQPLFSPRCTWLPLCCITELTHSSIIELFQSGRNKAEPPHQETRPPNKSFPSCLHFSAAQGEEDLEENRVSQKQISITSRDGTNLRLGSHGDSEVTSLPSAEEMGLRLGKGSLKPISCTCTLLKWA